jgi:uncharacterized protein (DUF4415 family)
MAKTTTFRSAKSKKTISSSSTPRTKTLSVSLLRGERAGARGADIRSATLDEIKEMKRRGELYPARPDAEEIELDEEFWKNAQLIMPGEKPKSSIHLRVDYDVLDWFKSKGRGHLTRMNAVLRAYYETNRKKAS